MRQYKEKMILAMEKYLYLTTCRRECLLAYFGDSKEASPDICCDNCSHQGNIYDRNWGPAVLLFLQMVNDCTGRWGYGKMKYVDALLGKKAKTIPPKLIEHPHHGTGKSQSRKWWQTCVQQLANTGLIVEKTHAQKFGSSIELTATGKQWLTNNKNNPTFHIQSYEEEEEEKPFSSSTTDTILASYQLFIQGKSIDEIATYRRLKASTIENHLAKCVENDLPLDFGRLGVSQEVWNQIILVINSDTIQGDISKLRPIKDLCSSSISYLQLKCVIGLLKLHLSKQPTVSNN